MVGAGAARHGRAAIGRGLSPTAKYFIKSILNKGTFLE